MVGNFVIDLGLQDLRFVRNDGRRIDEYCDNGQRSSTSKKCKK